MSSFFWPSQNAKTKARVRAKGSCFTCGLDASCHSPRMKAYGANKKGILVIGEAPGATEDLRGMPWQGKIGKLLRKRLSQINVNLFRDCLCVNAVNCRPPGNRTPTPVELRCCYPRVWDVIVESKPKIILLFGSVALQSFVFGRLKRGLGPISKWRGVAIPDQDVNAWVFPLFHPSYVSRMSSFDEVSLLFDQDIAHAFSFLDIPVPKSPAEQSIVYLQSEQSICDFLCMILKEKMMIAFDYETTGLKPHKKGHHIVCVSIAVSDTCCGVFFLPKSGEVVRLFKRILIDSSIMKIAHNMKFEAMWSAVCLGVSVRCWHWDTMQATHVLDNRTGICSLKHQVYVNFGVIDYDSSISSFLSGGDKKDANSMNRISDLCRTSSGRHSLLTYCGLDSLFEYCLAKKQMGLMHAEV